MPTITRTMKFAVYFSGSSQKDLEGKDGLWYQLRVAQGDLTRAANLTASALFLVRTGAIPHPTNEAGDLVPLKTLAWAPFRQKNPWLPFGQPVYQPAKRRLSAACLAEMANIVHTRLSEDFKGVQRGEQSLCTFRTTPIPFPKNNVLVTTGTEEDFLVTLTLWDGREHNRIAVAPVLGHREHGQREILRRIVAGTYKHGNARLFKDERKNKWMLALSWSGEVAARTGTRVAGIDLGVVTTATLAFVDAETGTDVKVRDRIAIPETVLNAIKHVDAERRRRLKRGRRVLEPEDRPGRGVTRKVRPIAPLEGKRDRLTQDAVRQVAAAIVKSAAKNGAAVIALEDLSWSHEKMLSDTEALSNRDRARARRNALRFLQGTLRAAIRATAEREGMRVVEVDARHSSNTCGACGTVFARPPATEPGRPRPFCAKEGRISQAKFKCSCAHEDHADHNAAVVVGQRGALALRVEQQKLSVG